MEKSDEKLVVPEEFKNVINDFVTDISNTFPETQEKIKNLYHNDELLIDYIFAHTVKTYPSHFFNIMYQNDSLFEKTEENPTLYLLPNIDFIELWNLPDVSDTTKSTIWKYLQIVLFSTVESIKDKQEFGDTAKIFEAINEDDFKEKLKDTMSGIHEMFGNMESDSSGNIDPNNLPNADDIHNHLSGMLEGKIGQLASEIAEEAAKDFSETGEIDGDMDTDEMLKKLMKNPTKIMGLMQKVGSKLDDKIKSGEIKESELMQEASEILNKMKDMPGMGNIEKMMKKMNIPGMGGKGKMNLGAMSSKLNQNMKQAQTKERLQNKLKQRQQEKLMKEAMESAIRVSNEKTQEQQRKAEEELFQLLNAEQNTEKTNANNVKKKKKKKKNKK